MTNVYDCQIVEQTEDTVRIRVDFILASAGRSPLVRAVTEYTILSSGEVRVDNQSVVREDACFLPRFGFDFCMPEGNEYIEYFGMGPYENYPCLLYTSFTSAPKLSAIKRSGTSVLSPTIVGITS